MGRGLGGSITADWKSEAGGMGRGRRRARRPARALSPIAELPGEAGCRVDRALAGEVLTHIEERVERVRERLVDLAFHSADARLASFLSRLSQRYGIEAYGKWEVDSKLSQQEIGYLTGLSRQSVATQMNVWRKDRIIDFDRSRIVINDIHALQKIARGT